MKKFSSLTRVLDGFRSGSGSGGGSSQPTTSQTNELTECLRGEVFNVVQTTTTGFPHSPTALAFEPVQKLLAIGCGNNGNGGVVRILGIPGVDTILRHPPNDNPLSPITIKFLNFATPFPYLLTTVSSAENDTVHLWNYGNKPKPEIEKSLRFQRERITAVSLPLESRWLYIGTDRGNIHFVNMDTFGLSGYVINWNKTIEITRKTHPGTVIHLSENPTDSMKLLIAYDSGALVQWDLKNKMAEMRWTSNEPLRSAAWLSDGKQFITSHSDGSVQTWNLKNPGKPVGISYPHARNKEMCFAISKIDWKTTSRTDNFVIFSGGLPIDTSNNALTIIHGKTTTVLEMEHEVVDFIAVCENVWDSEPRDPTAVIVLLKQDLVVIDLTTPGYPCIPNPYPMDIHESPVTCMAYVVDCPGDLIPSLYSIGSKKGKGKPETKAEWPIQGGVDQMVVTGCYAEILVTGHADGSIKFWDSTSMQFLYKLKTAKLFDRPALSKDQEGMGDDEWEQDPEDQDRDSMFAIEGIHLNFTSQTYTLTTYSPSPHVLHFKFSRSETSPDTSNCPTILQIPDIPYQEEDTQFDFSTPSYALKPRILNKKVPAGFQIEVICLNPTDSPRINSVGVGGGILAYGNDNGMVLIDTEKKVCLMAVAVGDLVMVGGPKSPTVKKEETTTINKSPGTSEEQQQQQQILLSRSLEAMNNPCEDNLIVTNPRQSLSGSMTKLPSENVREEIEEEVIIRPTTPPKKKKTWAQVKGLIIKNVRENKSKVPKNETDDANDNDSQSSGDTNVDEGDNETVISKPIPTKPQPKVVPPNKKKLEKKKNLKVMTKRFQKLDTASSNFSSSSRSRSSSLSSLGDIINMEGVQCLHLNESKVLHIGTTPTTSNSSSSIISYNLTTNSTSPVTKLRGTILTIDFVEMQGQEVGVFVSERQAKTFVGGVGVGKASLAMGEGADNSGGIIVVVKAGVTAVVRDSPSLLTYSTDGHIRIYSVPSLRQMVDVDFLPLNELSFLQVHQEEQQLQQQQQQPTKPTKSLVDPLVSIWGQQVIIDKGSSSSRSGSLNDVISKTICFSTLHGQGVYLGSPSEIMKFTVNAATAGEFSTQVTSSSAVTNPLYKSDLELPERPTQSFLAGLLFGSKVNPQVEREELFGESSAGAKTGGASSASRSSVAKLVGPSDMQQAKAGTLAGDVSRTRMMMIERGQKLGDLGDKTERMMNESENFSSAAHQLMLKYKDKKWYQL